MLHSNFLFVKFLKFFKRRSSIALSYFKILNLLLYFTITILETGSPSIPRVVLIDQDRVVLDWDRPFRSLQAPIVGYIVEYRAAGSSSWVQSNDYPVSLTRYEGMYF